LKSAINALEREGVHIVASSSFYETEPQDLRDQPWFINLALACETHHFPLQLLAILQRIEREAGRRRMKAAPKGPRVLDIDILLFGDTIMETPALSIPHPRMLERRFVLEPLLEIAPDLREPFGKQPLRKYLAAVANQRVRKLSADT
jgi:2-amino-4-hydroxy-6-hydroxymethyldihydropteridine diphosphokinase